MILSLPIIANASLQDISNLDESVYKLYYTKNNNKFYLNINEFSIDPNDQSLIDVWVKIKYPQMFPQNPIFNNDTTLVKEAVSCKEKGIYVLQLTQYLNKKQVGPMIDSSNESQKIYLAKDEGTKALINYVCNGQLENDKKNYMQNLVNS